MIKNYLESAYGLFCSLILVENNAICRYELNLVWLERLPVCKINY